MPPRQDPAEEVVNLPSDDSGFVEFDFEEPEIEPIDDQDEIQEINDDGEEIEEPDANEQVVDIWHPVDPIQPVYDAGKILETIFMTSTNLNLGFIPIGSTIKDITLLILLLLLFVMAFLGKMDIECEVIIHNCS